MFETSSYFFFKYYFSCKQKFKKKEYNKEIKK